MARRHWASVLDFYGEWFTGARRSYGAIAGTMGFVLEFARRGGRHYFPESAAMMDAIPSWFLPSLSGLTILGTVLWMPYKIHRRVTAELDTLKGTPPNLTLVGEPAITPYPPLSPRGGYDAIAKALARCDASIRITNLPVRDGWGPIATNVHATFTVRDRDAREYGPFVGMWEDRTQRWATRLDVVALGETRRLMLVQKNESAEDWHPCDSTSRRESVAARECELAICLFASSHVLPPIRLILTNLGKGHGLQLHRA
jgi:hypothetical protein